MIKRNDYDIDIAARTLNGEAASEPQTGQEAVAHVIQNRAKRKPWAGQLLGEEGAVAKVCLAPWQFSCWNDSDPNKRRIKALAPGQMKQQIDIVTKAFGTDEPDPTDGADHYHTVAAIPGYMWPPSWTFTMRRTAVIGNHVFYDSTRRPLSILRLGSTGDAVKVAQKKLGAAGFDPGEPDGIYGSRTFAAVADFQKANALDPDGVIGKRTSEKLGVDI